MATVTTSIGTRANENVNINSVSGTGPYTVTLASAPGSDTKIGDTLSDEKVTPDIYLITGISGSDLTVEDVLGAGVAPSVGANQAFTRRTYSTLQLWEDDLADTTLYPNPSDATGEVYDDGDTYDDGITFTGARAAGMSLVTLRPASGEGHIGIAGGGGAQILITSNQRTCNIDNVNAVNTVVEGMYWDSNSRSVSSGAKVQSDNGVTATFRRNMVCNIERTNGAVNLIESLSSKTSTLNIVDNFVFDGYVHTAASSVLRGIHANNTSVTNLRNENNTVHDLTNDTAGDTNGFQHGSDTDHTCKNNISVNMDGSGGGTHSCYNVAAAVDEDYNLADDTTAAGANSIDNGTPSFTSTVVGSEDLHLTSASDAINQGVDLGSTGYEGEIDIDGRDRDAEGDIWDMGADEFVATLIGPLAAIGVGI